MHTFSTFYLTYYKSAIINLASAKIEAKYGMLIFNQIMNLASINIQRAKPPISKLGAKPEQYSISHNNKIPWQS